MTKRRTKSESAVPDNTAPVDTKPAARRALEQEIDAALARLEVGIATERKAMQSRLRSVRLMPAAR